MLHPFVPFITEAIWDKLGQQAPVRGIDRPLPASELCVSASWPEPREDWVDAATERQVSDAQEVVKKIRDLRQAYGAAPSKAVEVQIKAGDGVRAALAPCVELIAFMANAASIDLEAAHKPKNAATAVLRGMEIFVLGVIDVAKETARLEKQQARIEAQIQGTERKLANQGFVAKAPPEVVEEQRERRAESESTQQRLAAALERLGAL
jgi:valyl-tRNA synthetase